MSQNDDPLAGIAGAVLLGTRPSGHTSPRQDPKPPHRGPTPPRSDLDVLLDQSTAPWRALVADLLADLEAAVRDLQVQQRVLADPSNALELALRHLPPEVVIAELIERHGRARIVAAAERAGAAPVAAKAHGMMIMTVELCRRVAGDTIDEAAARIARLGGFPKIRDRMRPSEAGAHRQHPYVFDTRHAVRAAYYRAENVLAAEADRWRELAIDLGKLYRESGRPFDDWLRQQLARWRERYKDGAR